jgi:hypothetical protein
VGSRQIQLANGFIASANGGLLMAAEIVRGLHHVSAGVPQSGNGRDKARMHGPFSLRKQTGSGGENHAEHNS